MRGVLSGIGAMMFLIGLGGIGGACEGEGSFLVAAIVFSIGFGLTLATYRKGESKSGREN